MGKKNEPGTLDKSQPGNVRERKQETGPLL